MGRHVCRGRAPTPTGRTQALGPLATGPRRAAGATSTREAARPGPATTTLAVIPGQGIWSISSRAPVAPRRPSRRGPSALRLGTQLSGAGAAALRVSISALGHLAEGPHDRAGADRGTYGGAGRDRIAVDLGDDELRAQRTYRKRNSISPAPNRAGPLCAKVTSLITSAELLGICPRIKFLEVHL